MIVTLKYADPEQLCERLNALLNKPGTPATIRLAQRRLSSYEAAATADTQAQRDNQNDKQDEKTGEYAPWWNSDRFRPDEEQPLSNIIGKVRFIPDSRSKAVLVVAPSEYLDYVHQMIVTLDQPAEQVMVKAVILQITHQNMTSLGLQLSSNPGAFAPLGENALAAFGFLKYFEQRGSANLGANTDVAALVDFLVKTTDAKVLNQPVLWAKDNEEAEFFRGRKVPRIEGSVSSEELTSIRQDVEFIPVGVTMRLRPNITPEKAIDLTINLIVSELEDELLLGNTVTSETNTTTHMIVDNGETLMLSGILFQNDRLVERKIPLLGDLPILDLLFKHQESVKTNDELLVFITPTVIGCESPAAQIELENAENRMHRSLADLAASVPPFHDNDHPGIWPQGDQK
jgi:general secretion pathway protein D